MYLKDGDKKDVVPLCMSQRSNIITIIFVLMIVIINSIITSSPGIWGIFEGKIRWKKTRKAENFRSYLDGHP